jgi:PqqD family protein of HPr-rel-A system
MPTRRIDGLLSERIDNELLVFNPATNEGHALNDTAAAVFNLCDGRTDRAAMAAALAGEFGLPADPAVLDLALSELRDAGLITGEDVPAGINRRTVIRRLGLSVMAAAALPIIETVLARPASMQGLGVAWAESPDPPPPAATATATQTATATPTDTPARASQPAPITGAAGLWALATALSAIGVWALSSFKPKEPPTS